MSFAIVGFVFLTLHSSGAASSASEAEPAFDHTHALWNEVLAEHVYSTGPRSEVDYKAIKKDPSSLQAYLEIIQKVSTSQYDSFSNNEKLAFLINAYNALTVKLIIDHYPVSSIKKIGGWFSKPWKQEFFTLFGAIRHLDYIEHEVIRKEFNEPRIHFALVCAAKGCPALSTNAYRANWLEAQFEEAAKSFLNDTTRNRFDANEGRFYLSKIFSWFGEDFVKKYGSVLAYAAPRIKGAPINAEDGYQVSYLSYDWTLNERKDTPL